MAKIVILRDVEKLLKLANMINAKEIENTNSLPFSSEEELGQYLGVCRKNHDAVKQLLKSGQDAVTQYQDDPIKGPVAGDIFSYIIDCVNCALQIVRNYSARKDFLKKTSDHVDSLIQALKEIQHSVGSFAAEVNMNVDTGNNIEQLAQEVAQFKDFIEEHMRTFQTEPSVDFVEWLKSMRMTFDQVLNIFASHFQYYGPFKDLSIEQKIQVFNKIREAAGRTKTVVQSIKTKYSKSFGQAMLLYTVASNAWDIYSSAHPTQRAIRDGVVQIAQRVGGVLIDEVVVAAVQSGLEEIEAATVFVSLAGSITSIGGVFIIGLFVSWFLDSLFDSGARAPISTEGLKCYIAEMPDGVELARQVANEN